VLLMVGTVAMAIGNGALALALIVSVIGVAVVPQFGLGVGFLFAGAFMLAFRTSPPKTTAGQN
jgi:type IV secretory pathway TrbD component